MLMKLQKKMGENSSDFLNWVNTQLEKIELHHLLKQGSRYLVKDFGTSKSPKSTRQRAKYFGRDCPASGTLR